MLGESDGGGKGGPGRTVGLADAHTRETLAELLDQLGGERGGAALESAEGAEVVLRDVVVLRNDTVNPRKAII